MGFVCCTSLLYLGSGCRRGGRCSFRDCRVFCFLSSGAWAAGLARVPTRVHHWALAGMGLIEQFVVTGLVAMLVLAGSGLLAQRRQRLRSDHAAGLPH